MNVAPVRYLRAAVAAELGEPVLQFHAAGEELVNAGDVGGFWGDEGVEGAGKLGAVQGRKGGPLRHGGEGIALAGDRSIAHSAVCRARIEEAMLAADDWLQSEWKRSRSAMRSHLGSQTLRHRTRSPGE